jgi:hypothetical protein
MYTLGPLDVPAEVADLWKRTFDTAFALMAQDSTIFCASDRDFNGCYARVLGTVQKLTQQFAGWDPYLAPQ